MASVVYDSWPDDLCKGNVIPSTDTVYGLLVTSSYAPDQATDQKRSDADADEVVGAGYTAGGQAVAVTVAKDTVNHKETLTFANNIWTASTISAAAQVLFKHRGGLATADNLYAYVDFGGTVASSDGTFTAQCTTPLTLQN